MLSSQENFLTPVGKTPPTYEVHDCPLMYCICCINSTSTRTSQLQPLGTRAGKLSPTTSPNPVGLPPTRAGARNGSMKVSSSSGDGPVPRTRARDLSSIIAVALGLLIEMLEMPTKRRPLAANSDQLCETVRLYQNKYFNTGPIVGYESNRP